MAMSQNLSPIRTIYAFMVITFVLLSLERDMHLLSKVFNSRRSMLIWTTRPNGTLSSTVVSYQFWRLQLET